MYGPKTEAAVRQFQTDQGIMIDGVVGPETYGQLGID
ncbi:peptidoglycan-binding domain-containing protein [Crocosphaera watsonii]